MTAPVRWHAQVEALLADGVELFVELGPGRVLAGLIRRIRRAAEVVSAVDPAGIEAAVTRLGR